jgi:hypothetical protein
MSNTNPKAGQHGHNILNNLIHAMNHSSSNAMTSSGDAASISGNSNPATRQQSLLQGTHYKLQEFSLYKLHKKSGKKQKYFVIFDDAPDKPGTARLEYFDSEKSYRAAMAKNPDSAVTNSKRSIILCTCFNINRRVDIQKYKHVIGLYRKDDTFSIIMKDENEMNEWLRQLLILQRGKECVDGDQPRPKFGKFFVSISKINTIEPHATTHQSCDCIEHKINPQCQNQITSVLSNTAKFENFLVSQIYRTHP